MNKIVEVFVGRNKVLSYVCRCLLYFAYGISDMGPEVEFGDSS